MIAGQSTNEWDDMLEYDLAVFSKYIGIIWCVSGDLMGFVG